MTGSLYVAGSGEGGYGELLLWYPGDHDSLPLLLCTVLPKEGMAGWQGRCCPTGGILWRHRYPAEKGWGAVALAHNGKNWSV